MAIAFSNRITPLTSSEIAYSNVIKVFTHLWYNKSKTAREVRSNLFHRNEMGNNRGITYYEFCRAGRRRTLWQSATCSS